MFKIKICGITRQDDAVLAAQAGADAIGLNFYAPSPRFVDLVTAKGIVGVLPAGVAKVGVFVNESLARIKELAGDLRLDFIQLHGDEQPELIAQLQPRSVVRAVRFSRSNWQPVAEYVAACRELDCLPAALLIDANSLGLYGGSGQTVDWQAVRQRPAELADVPIILAGGLTPENVGEAISLACPWGVDTASGVESAPGDKNAAKVERFISEARAALPG